MEPIRILHILHSMNRGGAENAIMNYYRHIDRNIIQFDFLLTDPNKTLFEEEIQSLGGLVFRVSPCTKINIFSYIHDLDRFFKKHPEYKIVHSHTSSKSVFPLAVAWFNGIPIRCSHSHNSRSEKNFNGLIRNLLKPFLKLTATDYLSCGNLAAEWLYGKRVCQSGRVQIFKNVIEANRFRYNPDIRIIYRKKYGISDDTLVLGHTARFCVVKNHFFDIELLYALKKMGRKVKLLLIGGGELETSIKNKARELNVEDDVIFAGIVPNVYDYEQAMDVFLLPSYYEGLPLSIVEAQVSGLPCFATEGAVSNECSVTNLVSYLPLTLGVSEWGKKIIETEGLTRYDRYEEIVQSGYDAQSSAGVLRDFYLRRYRESCLHN